MKIGDTVRFLSSVGGGKIVGFQKGNIVLVEDEDGFEIPTLASEVVVIEDKGNDYDMFKSGIPSSKGDKAKASHPEGKSIRSIINDIGDTRESFSENDDYDPSERTITFQAPIEERKGGDRLSAFLAFLPVDTSMITNTRFEIYLINDSNYYYRYNILQVEGQAWTLGYEGEIEPNTKLYIDEIGREDLDTLSRIGIQMLSYKRNKSFIIKPLIDVQLRIDGTKFYKLHTFQPNDFFEQNALIYTIVKNDEVARPLVIDANTLKRQMYAGSHDKSAKGNVDKAAEQKRNSRKGKDEPVICDLHADELLETTQGMSSADILQYQLDTFHKTLKEYGGKKGTKIIFIHGKGEGILRRAIIHELNYRYKQFKYQDASFQEYGYGATQVTI